MNTGRRIANGKEATAVTFNIKEQRCLEKSIQTLDLEKSYSLKLLGLDHRFVRVNYKHLKDRVSKIKSHLSAEEITDFKQLEFEGKIKPYYNLVNLTGALKIAAASKRLNLPQPPKRAKSDVSYTNTRSRMGVDQAISSRPITVASNLRRSNSVTGVFVDASESNTTQERSIAKSSAIRPLTAFTPSKNCQSETNTGSRRPATVADVNASKSFARSIHQTPTHALYSSHSAMEKEARCSKTHQLHKAQRDSSMSFLSDDSIDSNFGDDIQDGHRQELLLEEMEKVVELEEKKTEFFKNLEEYLRRNPQRQWNLPEVSQTALEVNSTSNAESRPNSATETRSHKRSLFQQNVNFDITTEGNYKKTNVQLWKDMAKCRYLRIPDDSIDLSGVVTLVSSQMKLFQLLNQKERDSFLTSAKV